MIHPPPPPSSAPPGAVDGAADPFPPLAYVPAHREGVVALIAACYGGYSQVIELDTLDADLLAIPEVYHAPDSAFWVLESGGRVIGTSAIKGTGPEEAELKRVFVDPACRGRGYGKRLVLWAFDWARRRGVRRVRFWSDVLYETAHGMYRRLGAEATGVKRHLGGRNDVYEYGFVMRLGPPA